ncbi:hypothetical protein Tco_1295134 [Tanacetum coccineum]
MIELEMLKLEKMNQKGECSNTGNAQRAKQSKKNGFHRAFSLLFGEDVEYFAPRLFFNVDKLEKQLNAEEFNEEIAMVVFKVLKNQLQQFITMQISMDSDDKKTNHFFTEYTLYDAQMFQNILTSLMDSIKNAIVERGLYKRAHDNREILNDAEENPSTSNVYSESSKEMSDLPIPKMPNESKLLKLFEKIDNAIWALRERIDKTLLKDTQRRWISDSQNELREFYKTDVIPMLVSLSKSSKELQQKLTKEVHELLNTFESMERKVDRTSKKNEILQNKIDQLLEANIGDDVRNHVM